MFILKDDFRRSNDAHHPCTLTPERVSMLRHDNAEVLPAGFSIRCFGAKYILAAPPVGTFCFKTAFHIEPTVVELTQWQLIFGYDEVNRTGLGLRFTFLESDHTVTASLLRVEPTSSTELVTKTIGICTLAASVDVPVEITVDASCVHGSIAGLAFDLPVTGSTFGSVALARENFTGEIIFRYMEFTSDDPVERREVYAPHTFVIPCTLGGIYPYRLTLGAYGYENGQSILEFTLDGGLSDRPLYPAQAHSGQHGTEFDRIHAPYVRLYRGNDAFTMRIVDGKLVVIDINYKSDYLRNYFGETKLPVSGYAALPFSDFDAVDRIAFGCAYFDANGFHSQTDGPWEFVFDREGTLLYEGEPRLDNVVIDIASGADKRIVSMIPKDLKYYEDAYLHAVRNHYFFEDEPMGFTATLHVPDNIADYTLTAVLEDVFGTPIREVPVESGRLDVSGLKLGVYHITLQARLGGTVVKEKRVAFEVFDENPDHSPQAASGLPFLYSTPNEDRFLVRDTTDPFNPKPNCNIEHYFCCSCFTPDVALDRETWRLTKLYRRKWYTWLDTRTVPDHQDLVKYRKVVENADYVAFLDSLNRIDGRLDPRAKFTRCDMWKLPVYNAGLIDLVRKYLAQKGDSYRFDDFTQEALTYVISTYGNDYARFITRHIQAEKLQDFAKLQAINPDVKSAYYGPYPLYAVPCGSGYSTIWYGQPCEKPAESHGFFQFEDYPYSCSYQTHRGAWNLSTLRLLCGDPATHPEVYASSYGGCPDGLVAYANPPLGNYNMPLYFQTTQGHDYVFCSAFFRSGQFSYWKERGMMMRDILETYADAFVRNWRACVELSPARPLRTAGFAASYPDRDEHYRPDLADHFGWAMRYNTSESNQCFLYEATREAGLNAPFSLELADVAALSPENLDFLVLPSLCETTQEQLAAIRRLHAAGVPLVAAGSVEGLEDLFCVETAPATLMLKALHTPDGRREGVLPAEISVNYAASSAAEVLLTSDDGHPLVIAYRNTLLINADIPLLNIDSFMGRVQYGRESISLLLRDVVRTKLRELAANADVMAQDECGISAFVTESGEHALVLFDYSKYTQNGLSTRVTEYRITFPSRKFRAILPFRSEFEPLVLYDGDGMLREMRVKLRPQQTAVFRLK